MGEAGTRTELRVPFPCKRSREGGRKGNKNQNIKKHQKGREELKA